jgi:hypothetical protein
MPATSKAQQRFMGMVHALQKGELSPSDVSDEVKDAADQMDDSDAEDYASTKHTGKPEHVPKEVVRKLREMIRQIVKENPTFLLKKEAAKRDYKAEYKKFQSSDKAKKYRAELNQYNRKKGTYGNGDGKDASHKGGKIVGFESQSKNRGRAEKSRLKKESFVKSCTVKEISTWLKTLEEFRYRKVRGVDARRVASFVNKGMNEEDLPISLQKKWEHRKYGREKHLATKYVEMVLNKSDLKESINEALPSWYKDAAKLVKQVMKKNRIKPISGGGYASSWTSIARKIRSGQEFAYSIKPSHEFVELYHNSLDQESKKIAVLAKKIVKDIKKAGMESYFADDHVVYYRAQDIAESINERKLSSHQKKAILIAIEMSGNMTGAAKKIERIKKGLSNDKKVKDALRLANESVKEARTINVEPNWEGMWRFFKRMAKTNPGDWKKVERKLGSEWLKIDKMAQQKGWKSESVNEGGMGVLSTDQADILQGIVLRNKTKNLKAILKVALKSGYFKNVDKKELLGYIDGAKQFVRYMKNHPMESISINESAVTFWQDMFRPGPIPKKYITQLIKKRGELPSKKHIKAIYRSNGNPSSSELAKSWKLLTKEKYVRAASGMWRWNTNFTGWESVNEECCGNCKEGKVCCTVTEKISKEEWAEYPKYARKLKPYMKRLLKIPVKVRVIKQANHNPWIDVRVARFGKDVIPNDFRKKALKVTGGGRPRDMDNITYGNITAGSVSMKYDHWVKLLGRKV